MFWLPYLYKELTRVWFDVTIDINIILLQSPKKKYTVPVVLCSGKIGDWFVLACIITEVIVS